MTPVLFLIAGMAMAAPAVKWPEVPLSFEPNMGQTAADVRYLARGNSYALYMACGETLLYGQGFPLRTNQARGRGSFVSHYGRGSTSIYKQLFRGQQSAEMAHRHSELRKSSVFRRLPRSRSHLLRQGRALEYDWIVSPGADGGKIRMTFETADRLRIDRHGDLVIEAGKNEYRNQKPGRRSQASVFLWPEPGSCVGKKVASALVHMTTARNS